MARFFRFTLRTFCIVALLGGVTSGWIGSQWRERMQDRQAVSQITKVLSKPVSDPMLVVR